MFKKKKKNKLNRKEFIKKKKKDALNYVNKYKKIITKHHNHIWCPSTKIKYKKIKTHSCYDIKKYTTHNIKKNKFRKIKLSTVDELTKSTKYDMILTTPQKNILNRWLCACGIMYNTTLSFIKTEYKKTGKLLLNFYNIRTQHLKMKKDKIITNSHTDKKKRIRTHMVDTAIKLAVSNYKSAITNLKNGNIKYFRIRYWRKNKKNKIMTIEKEFFKNGHLCKKVLGEIKYKYNKKIVNISVNCSSKLHYNIETKKYSLYVPTKIPIKNNTKTNIISLDPGIRTFMCGLSRKSVIKIGNTISDKIKKRLKRLDKIKRNKKIPNIIKRKNEKLCNRKIRNMVNELHWKSINYLIHNYGNILIGDMKNKS